MKNTLFSDLQSLRRKSGLSQADCAHLLDIPRSRISKLESGVQTPSVEEVCKLSLIFGEEISEMFRDLYPAIKDALIERMQTLPDPESNFAGSMTRYQTLERLAVRLSDDNTNDHAW
tara:strand:+ start:5940 stop:6290 length:351 start_codon:yes stop_codon:yes gene_type:complete